MVSLTVQQRDLLHLLLQVDVPISMADLAEGTGLSTRQVAYRLKTIKYWLAQHNIELISRPGVGLLLDCTPAQRNFAVKALNTQRNFELVLSSEERQQLFGLHLLIAAEPRLLSWFRRAADVSRTTVTNDLNWLETWLPRFGLRLRRRPNYGLEIVGPEHARRQSLAALLWGDAPFEAKLTTVAHGTGLTLNLSQSQNQSILQETQTLLRQWRVQQAFSWVAYAEDQVGGRFTDDAVLHLALTLAIQHQRVQANCQVNYPSEVVTWLQSQKVWHVATDVAVAMWPRISPKTLSHEISLLAMHLLAGQRNHIWPGDPDIDPTLTALLDKVMAEIALAFASAGLQHDTALRDGLLAHLIPAYMRQKFALWEPPSWAEDALSALEDEYQREYQIAHNLRQTIIQQTGIVLPQSDLPPLVLLLRAAFIRESTNQPMPVFIICPSGMATAQLLAARLKARFPSLEILGVISLRQLSEARLSQARLLISTVPVQPLPGGPNVVQVHPLLLPEDVEKITQHLF